jgi:hypothetical protein
MAGGGSARRQNMTFRRPLAQIYRWLRRFAEWHEENELLISVFELFIAFIGVLFFISEIAEDMHVVIPLKPKPPSLGTVQGVGELASFIGLTILIVARVVVNFRTSKLGHDFGALFSGPKRRGTFSTGEELFGELGGLCPQAGYLGSLISSGGDTRKIVLERFAKVSASQFSVRTYGEADPMWKTWEERYLAEWLLQFSGTLWRVPPDDPTGGAASGYFSVIVPVTEDSWKKIRYGHLSTALATIDDRAVAYFNSGRSEPFKGAIYIVAYGLNYVPAGHKHESYQPLKLLYTGVEHLSYLLHEFNVQPSDVNIASFSMICESPNPSLDMVLDTLGFAPVLADVHLDFEHTHIRKSQAGFRLFEIVYKGGMPVVGEPDRAKRFRDLLRQIGHRGRAAPPAEKPMSAVLAGET